MLEKELLLTLWRPPRWQSIAAIQYSIVSNLSTACRTTVINLKVLKGKKIIIHNTLIKFQFMKHVEHFQSTVAYDAL